MAGKAEGYYHAEDGKVFHWRFYRQFEKLVIAGPWPSHDFVEMPGWSNVGDVNAARAKVVEVLGPGEFLDRPTRQ